MQDVEDYTAHLPATHKETATYSGYGPDIVPLHNCNRGPDFGDKVCSLHQSLNRIVPCVLDHHDHIAQNLPVLLQKSHSSAMPCRFSYLVWCWVSQKITNSMARAACGLSCCPAGRTYLLQHHDAGLMFDAIAAPCRMPSSLHGASIHMEPFVHYIDM